MKFWFTLFAVLAWCALLERVRVRPAPSPDQKDRTSAPREADGAGIPPCCEAMPDGTYRSPWDL